MFSNILNGSLVPIVTAVHDDSDASILNGMKDSGILLLSSLYQKLG